MNRGFTLIEIIIVLALFGIVALFGISMNYNTVARSAVLEERDLLVSFVLLQTRAHALARVNQVSHGIRIDATQHQYIMFEGDHFNDFPLSHQIIQYVHPEVLITNTGGDDIVFEQLSGNILTGAGTITITDNQSLQKIVLNEVGQINW